MHRFFHLLVAASLLIISMGFTEVLSLLMASFHIGILFIQRKKNKKIPAEWALFSFLCLLCFTAMLLAPGNNARGSGYPDSHNFFHSAAFTFMQIARFGFEWISSAPLMILSILFISITASFRTKIPLFLQEYFFKPWISVLIFSWILFACIFPPYWATNILGQHRTVNTACFFFLLYLFICIGIYTNKYSEKINFEFLHSQKFKIGALAAAIIILSVTRNGYDACSDILSGRAQKFNSEMQQRFDVLSNAAGRDEAVCLKPLSEKPKSLFILDLTSDSTNWVNGCQAEYFNVKAIVCKE